MQRRNSAFREDQVEEELGTGTHRKGLPTWEVVAVAVAGAAHGRAWGILTL